MKNWLVVAASLGLLIWWGCNKNDDLLGDPGVLLEFSVDTLRFDTVFTELGSATRTLKVFNRFDQPIRISRISLSQGALSKFRLNVDGLPVDGEATDIEIAAQDSMYIFGEVTINPDDPLSISPFVIEDGILFETNGNEQEVVLEAWGQNANYIPSRFSKGTLALLSCDFGEVVWDDPKPYVIYGRLIIDSCTLNLPAGAQVYVHGGIAQQEIAMDTIEIFNDGLLFFQKDGNLSINGTLDNPVIIQGDRLEEPFLDEAGQWVGIRLGSKENHIEHATIRNSFIGILVDSSANLTMEHTQIYNTLGYGLSGQHSTIEAKNCLFYNNGGACIQLSYGGDYQFDYCTLASFGVDASALALSNAICYDFLCSDFDVFPLETAFQNCIIYGSRADEIILADFTFGQDPSAFDVAFDRCIVRVRDLLDPDKGGYPQFLQEQCATCINADFQDPLFMDPNENDYHLDTLSVAEMQANPIQGISIDLEGNDRDPSQPDIGCFEYQNQ
jgi:hypothetical protein